MAEGPFHSPKQSSKSSVTYTDLVAFAGDDLYRLPYAFRILLEAALREGAERDATSIIEC